MNQIFRALVGSQAYGTNTPDSDEDFKGIYLQKPLSILIDGLEQQKEDGKDDTSYEVSRFLSLLDSANPTVLELLYAPERCIVHKDPLMDIILEHRDKFLTKKCQHSFGGYAIQQITKASGLEKKGNWEKSRTERKTIIDFCHIAIPFGKSIPLRESLSKFDNYSTRMTELLGNYTLGVTNIDNMPGNYALYQSFNPNVILRGIDNEGTSNNIRLSTIPKELPNDVFYLGVLNFNLNAYQVHCKEYKAYETWLKERNEARYVDFNKHNQLIDGKNMLHCVRLLDMATEIATEGKLIVERPNANYLLSIRRGELNLQEIIDNCKVKIEDLKSLYAKSNLPNEIDPNLSRDILYQIRAIQLSRFCVGR